MVGFLNLQQSSPIPQQPLLQQPYLNPFPQPKFFPTTISKRFCLPTTISATTFTTTTIIEITQVDQGKEKKGKGNGKGTRLGPTNEMDAT